jgi:undecaprenyl-diphosphatase
MFALIIYFWKSWRGSYFANWMTFQKVLINVIVAPIGTGIVGLVLQFLIERIFLSHHRNKAEDC